MARCIDYDNKQKVTYTCPRTSVYMLQCYCIVTLHH